MTTPDPITTAREALAKAMQDAVKKFGGLTVLNRTPDSRKTLFLTCAQIAVGELEKLKAERDEALHQIEQLKDPQVVHFGMLRGGIACPSPEQIEHIYQGKLPSHAEITRLTSQLELYKAALEEIRSSTADGYAHRIATNALKDRQAKTDHIADVGKKVAVQPVLECGRVKPVVERMKRFEGKRLAQVSGVSEATISRMINGISDVRVSVFFKVLSGLEGLEASISIGDK